MKIRVDHYHHFDEPPPHGVTLAHIDEEIHQIMADLSRVQAEVAETGTAVGSAITLLENLAQMIRDNATDQAALEDIANSLDAQGTALAEAVVANTPAAPGGGTGDGGTGDGGTGGGETPPVDGGDGSGDGGAPI